jgi:hypothetical protein
VQHVCRFHNATAPWKVLAGDFRGNPRRITMIVKAVQTLQYLIRDPFGSARTVTTS